MFVPLPSNAIADLATSHRETHAPRKTTMTSDPDNFLSSNALQPDPIYMGLRSIVTTGPIGRLVQRFTAWQEAREDRRIAAEQAVSMAERIVRDAPSTSTIPVVRERREHDLAA